MAAPSTNPDFDSVRAEKFSKKLLGHYNGAALALMTSIGHRTGLFDRMAGMPPSTSQEIADATHLNERYVREWLGAMTVGGIVECDGSGLVFHLPAEHAACLTRSSATDNLSSLSQYFAILGSVEDRIIECFRNGGGVAYNEFGRIHEVMAEDNKQFVLPALIDQILPLVSGINEALVAGIDVLDVGCGSGGVLNLLARTFPNSRFVGYDLCEEALQAGRTEAAELGLDNVHFQERDLTELGEQSRYDLITAFDAIHDQKAPELVLRAIARALRPQGTFLIQDIAGSSHIHKNLDHPIGPLMYTISCMHCMTVSVAQGGDGLGAMWGMEKAHELLELAGFHNVKTSKLPHDLQNNYYVARIT